MKQTIVTIFAAMFIIVGCKGQKTTSDSTETRPERQERPERPERGQRQGPPSIDEIFKMDANQDGKLAKLEVKGPLKRDFDKIDSNKDGFITRKELENAPKPERGQGPPPRNDRNK